MPDHPVGAAGLDQRGDRRRLPLADGVREGRRARGGPRTPATRPPPFLRRRSWATTALRTSERTIRTCSCSSGGKPSMSRSTALAAEFVWSVPKTRRPGLGGVERHPHRLEVAQLADEDRVGVLAERGLQGGREGRRVGPELAVRHDRRLRDVDELDRVLDRDDVVRLRPVDPVDEGGERRRLPRAGRAGDEDEAAERPARRRRPARGARGPPPSGRAGGSSGGRRPARAPAGRGSRGSGPCRPSRRRSRRRPSSTTPPRPTRG